MDAPRVAVVNARPETILEDVHRAMVLAGWQEHLGGADAVVMVAAGGTPRWLVAGARAVLAPAGGDLREAPAPQTGLGALLLGSLAADPRLDTGRILAAWRPPAAVGRPRRPSTRAVDPAPALLRRECPHTFVLMDATECGGTAANVLLAGADPAAIDAVAARLAGFTSELPVPCELVGDADARGVRVTPRGRFARRRETPWSRLRQEWEGR